jgi:hypothetical protein
MIQTKEQKRALVILIAIIVLIVIYKISSCSKPKVVYNDTTSAFDTKIEALDKQLKQYEASRMKTDSLIVLLQDSMAVLQFAIKSKDQQIKNLKAKHEKERIDISKFTNADIQKFLSDRYGK